MPHIRLPAPTMRTTPLLTALLLAGCGVSEASLDDVGDDTAAAQGELGTSTRSYVVLRHDQRRCVSPMCGGYWAHDVNRASVKEQYVSGLDFSQSNLAMPEDQADVTGAADFEVVLWGKLGPLESRFNTRPFLVTSAWRGMPGVKFTEPADTFYRVEGAAIQCIAAPCPTLRASKLHTTAKILHHDLDVSRASRPLVDQDWLTFRTIAKDALVAGRFVDGALIGASREKVLAASQVFVHLPDMTQSCPRPALARCPAGQVNLWTRNENRCLMPSGCGGGGVCAASVPACADGYSLVSWSGGPFGCSQFACDPAFLND